MTRLLLLVLTAGLFGAAAFGQRNTSYDSAEEARSALAVALAEQRAAELRSVQFEQAADEAEGEAEIAARKSAAIAARVQQAEAGINAARTRIAMFDTERADLEERVGSQQRPIVRLTAALQQFSRRPVALAVLRPGSVKELVYLRAMLHDALPQVRSRTQGLRDQLTRGRELRRKTVAASSVLIAEEAELSTQRNALTEHETEQRLAARRAGGQANREADRVLALAENARDLEGLIGELDRNGRLRERLAALPGPTLRPSSGEAPEPTTPSPTPSERANASGPRPYILPVAGRTVTGFGALQGEELSKGITFAPLAGAQIVAPANGRVAFAGPYRGYGWIVIIDHAGGWTSLVTGLARADVEVGEALVGGAPLGVAGPDSPRITLELRRGAEWVNPLNMTR